jgi:TolB-like protein/Tfp pilus assembly protein PilF
MNIMVYPFECKGSKDYSWISAGMTDTVVADLNRIQTVSVITDESRKKALKEIALGQDGILNEETTIKVGKITGANLIFTGSYMVEGDRVRVFAKLINVETGAVKKCVKLDGTINRIFDLQDTVVFKLMAEAEKVKLANVGKVHLSENDKKKIIEKQKPKLEAYTWYAKGLEIEDINPKQALAFYKKALEIDPDYLKPLLNIGSLLGNTFNRFSEALDYFYQADQIYKNRKETDSAEYANLLNSIGLAYLNNADFDRALIYLKECRKKFDDLGLQNTATYANLIGNIGDIYNYKGDKEQAEQLFRDAYEILYYIGDIEQWQSRYLKYHEEPKGNDRGEHQ